MDGMKLWRNSNGDLFTDEQLVAYVAAFGSLSAAAAEGDVVLIADDREDGPRPRRGPGRREPKLAYHLVDDGYGPEREREILKDVEDWRAGRLETVSLDELEEKLGLDD